MQPLLLLAMLLLLGSPPVFADVIRTLTATSGSIGERQDVPFGNISGDNFGLGGIFHSFGEALPGFSLALNGPQPIPGQLFDQSGPFILNAELFVDGQVTGAGGGLTLHAVPSPVIQTSPGRAIVESPFVVVSGLVTTTGVCYFCVSTLPAGQQYAIRGQGTMTSVFFPCDSRFCGWDMTTLTFTPSAQIIIGSIANDTVDPSSATVPEPSTWLLLTSGVVGLLLMKRLSKGEDYAAKHTSLSSLSS